MTGERMRSINEVMRKVIGSAISSDLQDPRIGFVTVTAVDTSPDLRSARVYVSVLGSAAERGGSLDALRSSHGVLQSHVGTELRLKRTPVLEFVYDESIDQGMRISKLLDEAGDS